MGIGNFFNDLGNKVSGFVNDKKEQYEAYNKMIDNSKTFNTNNEITINNDNISAGSILEYTKMCPYINSEIAKNIDVLIPFTEVVLYISYAVGKKDNKKYVIVLTDMRILIISGNNYLAYEYEETFKFQLISKSLMSQLINFNDVILDINLNQEDFKVVYNLVVNKEYRNSYILDKKKYLCGITPIYQCLNEINSGISMDKDNNIVFHDKKEKNYLCKYEDIENYELLEDSTPVLKKKVIGESRGMGAIKQECTSMSLRITLKDGKVFQITILEGKAFNATFSHMNSDYIRNYEFAKGIILKFDGMNPRNNI